MRRINITKIHYVNIWNFQRVCENIFENESSRQPWIAAVAPDRPLICRQVFLARPVP